MYALEIYAIDKEDNIMCSKILFLGDLKSVCSHWKEHLNEFGSLKLTNDKEERILDNDLKYLNYSLDNMNVVFKIHTVKCGEVIELIC